MTSEQYLALINACPCGVKDADDGDYKFIPISLIEALLDAVFGGSWSFDFDRETFGKGYVIGKGRLMYQHPVTGVWITKSGTAGMVLSKEITMDYPRIEAAVLLNAAKKIGRAFGRDLNRDRDDAHIPTIQVDKGGDEGDVIFENDKAALRQFEYREDAAAYLAASAYRHNVLLEEIVKAKPPKV